MNGELHKIDLVRQALQKRASIVFDALYIRKSYEDEQTRNFWEGKWSAYSEAVDLLKSTIESIEIEL